MAQTSKRRPKSQPEPLDWKELASGPALRGLSEVLGTPAGVARERAALRRSLDESGDKHTEALTPSVGETAAAAAAPAFGEHSTAVVETPTEGTTASVGEAWHGTAPVLWVDANGTPHEAKRVQRVEAAEHSMTLGEERFYRAVWNAGKTAGVEIETPHSKLFSIGYDRLAHLVRLDEKSVRQLIPKLVSKKALEIVAGEDSAARIGRTYRIFSRGRILARQREAGLEWIVKRGRAIEFVWRAGSEPGSLPTDIEAPTVGDPSAPLAETPAGAVHRVLAAYAQCDAEAVLTLIGDVLRLAPDAKAGELVDFIHQKGRMSQRAKLTNPLAYLMVYVPKCFQNRPR